MSNPLWVPMGADLRAPRGLWRLDDSDVTMRDASGFGHHGSYSGGCTFGLDGPPALPGSKCVQFDGVNGHGNVAYTAVLNIASAFTVAAWVYPTAGRGTNLSVGVVTKAFVGTLPFVLGYGGEGTEYTIPANCPWIGFYNGTWRSIHGAALTLNTWTHIAGTFDGAMLRFYRNGVEESSKAASGNGGNSGGIYVARRWDTVTAQPYFPGRVDQALVASVAWTPAEIAALYAGSLPMPAFIPTS
jgi:hypothetical protein